MASSRCAAISLVASIPLLLIAESAHACRCAEQPLDTYVVQAEIVFFGRVAAVENRAPDGDRTVRFAIEGSPFKGRVDQVRAFVTPASTAGCGVPVAVGERYLVFASRSSPSDSMATFNTCNGTRRFDTRGGATVRGFIDAEPVEVVRRLGTLRQTTSNQPRDDPRASATPRLPRFGDPDAELIGLLELPTLLDGENGATPAVRKPLTVYKEPTTASAVEVVRDAQELSTREAGYELPAVVVRAVRDGWLNIALARERSGWIRAADAGTFHPIAQLLINRLTYLNDRWDGWIWPASGAGHPVKAARRDPGREQPVRIVASEEVGDSLWLQIELLDGDPCSETAPNVVHAGWIPAYTPEGQLTAWFYSRGC